MFVNNSVDSIPPPPPLPPEPRIKKLIESQVKNINIKDDWVLDIEKSFQRLNKDEIYTGYYVFKNTDSLIQEGPTCGLVALVMAAQVFNKQLSVEDALKVAREKQFSNHGEMFYIKHMKELSEQLINIEATLMHDLSENKAKIQDHLIKGYPLLVPYDADANHEPVVKKGYRAHWAIILGFCILSESQSELKQLKQIPKEPSSQLSSLIKSCPDNLIMVLAKQGKSRHVKWWAFNKLSHSNRGLDRVNPKIECSDGFIFPEDGSLKNSLANQFLMIKPK